MKVSITKAASLSGVSRTTLYTDMNSGKLSFHTKGKNKRTIDVAELERVYGELNIIEDKKVSSSVKDEQTSLTKEAPLTELAVLRGRVEMLDNHSRREREQYEGRIESLESALSKAQDGYNSITKLLEHQSENGAGNLEKSFKALEARLANQEKAEKDREQREEKTLRQNKVLRKALHEEREALKEERSRGFIKKLFG